MTHKEQALRELGKRICQALTHERSRALSFGRTSVEEIYQALLQDARETAGYYPDFDLRVELGSQEFLTLLRAGFPIRRAYEAVHHQQLVDAALHYGATHAIEKRPGENALEGMSTAHTPGDVAHMSRDARQAILQRVARGETVRL